MGLNVARTKAKVVRAVIDAKLAGVPTSRIAKQYGISEGTVFNWWKAFKKGEITLESCEVQPKGPLGQKVPTSKLAIDYKQELKVKSVEAVTAGLDDPSDNYKRAGLGIQVLKGIGEFTEHHSPKDNVFNVLVASMPPDLANEIRDRLGRDTLPVIDITPAEGKQKVSELEQTPPKPLEIQGIDDEQEIITNN